MAPNPAPASIRNYPFFTPVEAQMLARANQWFADHFWPTITAATSTPTAAADPVGKLLILCMTPRSGSTALSQALSASRMMGLGGERLGPGPLKKHIATKAPQSMAALLAAVITGSRTKSGVAQIKCDLPQLLPFLVDPDCLMLLEQAQFVYLTREDVLGQAISRYRGAVTGHWHTKAEAGTEASSNQTQIVPYDFDAIKAQVDQLARMMAAYERVFAAFGLSPLRITYEQVTADSYAVMARMAALLRVTLPPDVSLADGGHIRTATGNNDDLRARYIADCRAALGRYEAGAGPGETAAAAVNAAT